MARVVAIPALLVLSLIPAFSQSPSVAYEITGKVLEFGSKSPLAAAEITLECYEGEATSSLTPKKLCGQAKSADDGSFRFTPSGPGSFRVQVSKEGFQSAPTTHQPLGTGLTFHLKPESPKRTLTFWLARPVRFSGILLDKDTQDPVKNHLIIANEFRYFRGVPGTSSGAAAITGADGRFTFPELSPGQYVFTVTQRFASAREIQNRPERSSTQDRLLAQFTEADLTATDLDYPVTIWPGGAGIDSAYPIRADSGADIDIGKIEIRKLPLFRLRLEIPDTVCPQSSTLSLHLRSLSNPSLGTSVGDIACGSTSLLRGLPSGAYRLEIMNPTAKAFAEFTIADRNASLTVPLERGVTVTGKFTAPDSTLPDPAQLTFYFRPLNWAIVNRPPAIDAQGRFRAENIAVRDYQILLNPPPSHYLAKLLYNGAPSDPNHLTLNPYAPSHSLELILGDKPAALEGSVIQSNQPIPSPWVVLCSWPLPQNLHVALKAAYGNSEGRFQFSGLPPGEYRAIAVLPELRDDLDRPYVLEQLLRAAPKITLAPSQSQSVELKPASIPGLQ
ncbi:MAG: carboxypeptidase regulatory-like domain-containing protein [Acidobacteria bacterium]|nr:carboxypeptidase regulatory-like domain-containing protein [Acidobacteriota bacterium]